MLSKRPLLDKLLMIEIMSLLDQVSIGFSILHAYQWVPFKPESHRKFVNLHAISQFQHLKNIHEYYIFSEYASAE